MNDLDVYTYQTRFATNNEQDAVLDDCATLFAGVERCLFAKLEAGASPGKLKTPFLKQFDITARQFNSVRIQLQGRINSLKQRRPQLVRELEERISSLKQTIKKLEKHKQKRAFLLHQKKRRLHRFIQKANQLKNDISNNKIRLCFGSKKLFRSQFSLEENGFSSHLEWKETWKKKRATHFFVVGSKDETASNQSCQATLESDGSLTLKLRLPNALKEHGKYLLLKEVKFAYGHQEILKSLEQGRAISYCFKKDRKGWLVFAMTQREDPELVTKKELGAIGIDVNANHIALVETDRFGNPITKKTLPLNTYGKSSEQCLALIGDVCAHIVLLAKKTKKPLVFEALNFQKKKGSLKEGHSKKQVRMLSSFTYTAFFRHLHSRAARHGVKIFTVNPAYTSVIGRVKFAKRYGLSIHHAASLTIARRLFRFSEQPPLSADIPDGKGDHVTLSLPVRNRGKHVWSVWRRLIKKIKAALAEHFRAKKTRSKDPPPADLCDRSLPKVVGAIPARESLATLLG